MGWWPSAEEVHTPSPWSLEDVVTQKNIILFILCIIAASALVLFFLYIVKPLFNTVIYICGIAALVQLVRSSYFTEVVKYLEAFAESAYVELQAKTRAQ